ncbi:MAG: hypothetical protein CMH96_03295 [Oceanospirillaceae bacterium]|nr:hypothetical protein [Oceanospirillaceae bacterium]HCI02682.1 hypothetical protein [Oceanospirillaceae bacterium]
MDPKQKYLHHDPDLLVTSVQSDHSYYQGEGLGLAIVKHIMHRHQGRLDIVSELGKGSRFTCIFPHPKQPLAASLYAATHG